MIECPVNSMHCHKCSDRACDKLVYIVELNDMYCKTIQILEQNVDWLKQSEAPIIRCKE